MNKVTLIIFDMIIWRSLHFYHLDNFFIILPPGDHSPVLPPTLPGPLREAWRARGQAKLHISSFFIWWLPGFFIWWSPGPGENVCRERPLPAAHLGGLAQAVQPLFQGHHCQLGRQGFEHGLSAEQRSADEAGWREEEDAADLPLQVFVVIIVIIFRHYPLFNLFLPSLFLLISKPPFLAVLFETLCFRVFKDPEEPFISGSALEAIVHITNKYYLTDVAKHAVYEEVQHDMISITNNMLHVCLCWSCQCSCSLWKL